MKTRNFIYVLLFLSLTGCEPKPTVREYKEITRSADNSQSSFEEIHSFLKPSNNSGDMSVSDSQTQSMLEASKSNLPLTWKTPDGWKESKGSSMRIASFENGGTDRIDCSIVSLGGEAGGLEANVIRWLGQLGIQELTPKELKEFISSQEKIRSSQGFEMVLVDFTKLQTQEATQQPSMLATILNSHDSTVFIKMSGSKKAVMENRAAFKSLCQSIQVIHE